MSVAIETLRTLSYVSRAKANDHLRRSFGIMNPFVIGDEMFHDKYVKIVRQRVGSTLDWSAVVDVVVATASQIPTMTGISDIRSGIRIIVMSVALEIVGVNGYSLEQLTRVSELINILWIHAKRGVSTSPLRNELYAILQQWQHDDFVQELARVSSIRDSPALLSVLIPAYETMYRVVLPLIYHTHGTIAFHQFLSPNVSFSQLSAGTGQGYPYLALIQETLRLYPVVKRIKRSTFWEDIAIDVEAIHLDSTTWENSTDFDPERWTRVSCRGGFIPFGAGPGRCVANERIVGMVVCIVLGVVEDKLKGLEKHELRGLLLNDRENAGDII